LWLIGSLGAAAPRRRYRPPIGRSRSLVSSAKTSFRPSPVGTVPAAIPNDRSVRDTQQ
jgi:hypothetical protein